MKFAIIAAGEGSRLAAEGITTPKPLVDIGGEKLVDRLMRIFAQNGAEEIVVICNEKHPEVREHLASFEGRFNDIPMSVTVKTTPSSMHSFFEISEHLADAPFVLTTVDTIFKEEEFTTYIDAFQRAIASGETGGTMGGADGMMGVTDYIDDESPLYVETNSNLTITNFLDKSDECSLISGGIYGLTPRAIATLRKCIGQGNSRMRNFQRALIADGLTLKAHRFSKVLDIDHAEDIAKAEHFLTD